LKKDLKRKRPCAEKRTHVSRTKGKRSRMPGGERREQEELPNKA